MEELKDLLLSRGAALVGFADVGVVDERTRRGYPFAVSFAVALTPEIIAEIVDGPTERYCGEYDRANSLLDDLGGEAARFLLRAGYRADPRPATTEQYDADAFRASFQHKTAATLAGLGWIGKCALLVTDRFGSAVRWGTVLTDAPLPAGTPIVESRCGDCVACVEVCPGRACSGKHWRQGLSREDFWDARACREAMRQINRGRGTRREICGMCIAACPHTRAYLARAGAWRG